ncbi:hypothetical protein ISN45_Un206g000010 [Arabidopsis thaliana x Arabidopsis arenosa]|uniref:Retroviral polymerase SH3-like domain-containing protein n=1 Tax=Arabidopsis thaliana x Arabidopsis arenosa TaxID=1240361 RepID=A0A8T1X8R7_9BRAS|nr:hypothetical protein ISN45_Un206g000010 [Arabidopsis thaliana x Arabidopsis arenosa]
METSKKLVTSVILQGRNYLTWSRTTKTVLCGRGLWSHVISSQAPKEADEEEEKEEKEAKEATIPEEDKWFQEDQAVLALLQNSLEASILEGYSYCETAKELWDTLKNVYGNESNLTRVFEVKKAINELSQEDWSSPNTSGSLDLCVPGEQRNKLDAKSTRCMFLGYSTTQKGYKCYDPTSNRTFVSRDVKFLEDQGYTNKKDWEDLKDLAHSTTDRAASLKFLWITWETNPITKDNARSSQDSTQSSQPSTRSSHDPELQENESQP